MRHWLKLMSLFLVGFALTAQGDADLKFDEQQTKPNYQHPSVKVNIGGLVNTLNTGIGFSIEYPLAKRLFIEAELGPVFYGQFVKSQKERHLGLRTRGSLKYLVNISDNDSYMYIKGVIKYNRVNSRRFATTLSLDGNFSQEQLVDGFFETYGPSFHLGALQLLGENDRFFVDYSAGLGLIFWNYPLERPAGFELIDETSFLFSKNTSGGFFDLAFVFKIGMFLGKG